MKFKMKWAAAAAAALLTCGVSAQADNYDLTYQAIETQMLIGDVSQFSSELDGAMTKAPAESAQNTEVSEKTPRIVLVEKGDAYGATLVDGKVIHSCREYESHGCFSAGRTLARKRNERHHGQRWESAPAFT
mgnify:CR=1 FL=1